MTFKLSMKINDDVIVISWFWWFWSWICGKEIFHIWALGEMTGPSWEQLVDIWGDKLAYITSCSHDTQLSINTTLDKTIGSRQCHC